MAADIFSKSLESPLLGHELESPCILLYHTYYFTSYHVVRSIKGLCHWATLSRVTALLAVKISTYTVALGPMLCAPPCQTDSTLVWTLTSLLMSRPDHKWPPSGDWTAVSRQLFSPLSPHCHLNSRQASKQQNLTCDANNCQSKQKHNGSKKTDCSEAS